MPLSDCCKQEASKRVQRHRDKAICDKCKSLIIGYGNEADFQNVLKEFSERSIAHDSEKLGSVFVISKHNPAVSK